MEDLIKEGDVVELKSDSIKMTVITVDNEKQQVRCVFEKDGEFIYSTQFIVALRKVMR